jgi:hypothetical protein
MADAFHHRDGQILQKLTEEQVAHGSAPIIATAASSASFAGSGRRPAT